VGKSFRLTKNQIEIIEAKNNYKLKDKYLEQNFPKVSPEDFYSDLFCHNFEPHGFDCSKTSGIGNPIAVSSFFSPDGKTGIRSKVVTENEHSTFYKDYTDNQCALISPVVYYGRTAKAVNARFIYALVVDLDYVFLSHLKNLLGQIYNAEVLPLPTYIVNSGTGLHLYYVANEPYPAYPQTRTNLGNLKKALIRICWNAFTSNKAPNEAVHYDPRQYSGVTQGYRIVGSLSKLGSPYPVTAYRTGDKWHFEDLTKFLRPDDQIYGITEESCLYKSELPLFVAKEKYPEWYKKRVIEKQPKNTFNCNSKLYDWWIKKISSGVTVGHRYYCIGMLAVYAVKSGVSKDRVLNDLEWLVPMFDSLGNDSNNHFLMEEAKKAVDSFYNPEFKTLPINSIIHFSGIQIQKNKRNGRTQTEHIEFMNLNRQFKVKIGECTNGGRPEKAEIVKKWKQSHPDGNKLQCSKDTGLSRTTVIKWW